MRAPRTTPILAILAFAACAVGAPTRLEVERELRVPGGYVTTLAWSPDGTRLAVGGMASEVIVVDAAARAADLVLGREGTHGAAIHVCWSADGSRLAVDWRTTGLSLYDLVQQRAIATRPTLHGPIVLRAAAGEFVCLDAGGHPARVADHTLVDRGRHELPPGGQGRLLALSPDGNQLAVAVTHTVKVFTFDLATGGAARQIAEASVLGLSWPVGAGSPWWLDTSANVLHGLGATRRCVADGLVVQHDGSRIAVHPVAGDGWQLIHADGGVVPIGQEPGPLALHPDGEAWASGSFSGRLVLGRGAAVVRSLPAPVSREYVTGRFTNGGAVVVAGGDGPHAFALATGAAVPVAGVPREGEVVVCDQEPQLVWRDGDQVSWWTLDERAPPKPGRRVEHRFHQLPELSPPAELHGRWLIRGAEAVDILGELQPPRLRPSLGGDLLLPVRADAASWVALEGERLGTRNAGGEVLRELGREEAGGRVRYLAVSPGGTRIAVGVVDDACYVYDAATGTLVGECRPMPEGGVRFVDDDTLLGLRLASRTDPDAIVLATAAGRVLAAIPGSEWRRLLDVAPSSRRALVSAYGRLVVLAWR